VRICLVGQERGIIPPEKGGGIEALMTILAKGLVERGHEVSIVCGKAGDRSQLEGVIFHELGTPKLLGLRVNEVLYGIEVLFFLRVKRKSFDLIHFSSFHSGFFASVFKSQIKKPMIYTTYAHHAWDPEYEQIPSKSRVVMRLRAYMKRRVDRVVVSSLRMEEHITEYTKIARDRIRVIYEAVDGGLFSPKYGREARRTLGLDDRDLMILFAGRLVDAKGVEYVLKAVPIVKKEIANVKLVLVGAKETGTGIIPHKWLDLRKQLDIEDDVIFTGTVSYEMLAKTYSSADIFVLPTMMETFPLTIAEAMFSGLPIISTDTSDIPLVINECGIVVRQRDEVDVAKAIIRLAEDRELRERYAKRALQVARERFSIPRYIDEHEQVYAECLKGFK
jgi:glycosyltransferase involved in cell wall biosynthesis